MNQSNRNFSESYFVKYFKSIGYQASFVAEDPPDILLIEPKSNRRLAVEVTEIHERNYGTQVSIFHSILNKFEEPYPFVKGNSWHCNIRFHLWPINSKGRKAFLNSLRQLIQEIQRNIPTTRSFDVKIEEADKFTANLKFIRSGNTRGFQFNFEPPNESGARWVGSNMLSGINCAVGEKSQKVARVIKNYDEFWIAIDDHIGCNLSEADLMHYLASVESIAPFNRLCWGASEMGRTPIHLKRNGIISTL